MKAFTFQSKIQKDKMSERTNIFVVYVARRASSVCSRAVERSDTDGYIKIIP